MTCPACTPQRPCEVCASLGQPLGLLPEPVAEVISPGAPEPAPEPEIVLPTTGDKRLDRLMGRLHRAIRRGDSPNAAKCRTLIRRHCEAIGMAVPAIAGRQAKGPRPKGVAA